jgi:hypothetical protein
MTEATTPTRPIPLRAFLDAGADPRLTLGPACWGMLVDPMRDLLAHPNEDRTHGVRVNRATVDYAVAGEPMPCAPGETDQAQVTFYAWTADLLEDPTLVDRLRGYLSVEENDALDRMVDCQRRPYPLHVGAPPEHVEHCCACGDRVGRLALSIGCREGWSQDGITPEVAYCVACVTIASEAMKSARP